MWSPRNWELYQIGYLLSSCVWLYQYLMVSYLQFLNSYDELSFRWNVIRYMKELSIWWVCMCSCVPVCVSVCLCVSVHRCVGRSRDQRRARVSERQEAQPLPWRSFQDGGANLSAPTRRQAAPVLEKLTGDRNKTVGFKRDFQVLASYEVLGTEVFVFPSGVWRDTPLESDS